MRSVMQRSGMASMACLMALGLLAGCGGGPTPTDRGPAGAQIEASTARGMPATGGRRLLIVAAPGVDDISFFAGYYALVAAGWSVRVATPTPAGTTTADGRAVPSGLTFDGVKPADRTVLYVPAGLPADPAIDRLIAAAAAEGHLVVAPGAGPRVKAAGVSAPLADDEGMVRIEGNVLSGARPGDLPHLVWTLGTYADDRLVGRDGAAGGDDPP